VDVLFGPDMEVNGDIACAWPASATPGSMRDEAKKGLYRFTLEGNPQKFYIKMRYCGSRPLNDHFDPHLSDSDPTCQSF